jgi:protein TonB
MLENTLFAGTIHSTWAERARRGWLTLTSFGLQALALAVLLILPLLRPNGIPTLPKLSTPISLGNPIEPAPARRAETTSHAMPIISDAILRMPSHLPIHIADAGDDASAPPNTGPYIPGSIPGGDPRGIPNVLGNGTQPVIPVHPPAPVAHSIRLSHMSEGDLIRRVQPAYPPLARAARIQGVVVLQATIGQQGAIENLQALSGHPMLVRAAIDAVRQWRYRPYLLNGEPVEVETQVTVNFSLAGS